LTDEEAHASPSWKMSRMKMQAEAEGSSARDRICEEQLRQALGKCEFADVRFEVAGAWVASGHRSVLGARSPVFARMFRNDTYEKNTGVVRLDDVTPQGLLAFLELVYLGTDGPGLCDPCVSIGECPRIFKVFHT
jgi:hypothetical protein